MLLLLRLPADCFFSFRFQTNCLSEVLFPDALAQAELLDSYYRTHRKAIGPLHGLPISLKDQFRVKGAETSVGYISWLGNVETEETESWLVKQLRFLGAIVYCKTNVPTSLMVRHAITEFLSMN